jgi:hypothetical protein
MGTKSSLCLMLSLTCSVYPAYAQYEQPGPTVRDEAKPLRLVIGAVKGLPRPENFVVEDLRSGAMKTPARKQTYRRPAPALFGRAVSGPLARYERVIGDTELNVSPLDLIAERFIERYADKLKGYRLSVREFSFVIQESIDKPQGLVVIPLDPASIAIAVVTSIAGTAFMQALSPGRSARLQVTFTAELDGKRVTGSDFGSIVAETINDMPAKIVSQALDNAFYHFDNPEPLQPSEEPPSSEDKGTVEAPSETQKPE